eukprot:1067157-Prymnesium_polylepis.2
MVGHGCRTTRGFRNLVIGGPHHGSLHSGPDCSSRIDPPTMPAGHAYGKSESRGPGSSCNEEVVPWMKR